MTSTALWASDTWLADATTWIDERLADDGAERTGDVEQPHLKPWATVLRVPTDRGDVWFKAAGTGTAFEIGLYAALARTVPEHVLTPIALDLEHSWALLPDGGRPIGERLEGPELAGVLGDALVTYGELQLAVAPQVDDLLALGVADMRPAAMPRRFDEALEKTAADLGGATQADREAHARVAAMRPEFVRWCEQLTGSVLPPTLDHNDLHPWNILGGDGEDIRFYDWGDAVVAHPFAAMLVPLGFAQRLLEVSLDDPAFARIRDAYLDLFAAEGRGEDLASTLALACRVAKIARSLTWDRAVSTAKETGQAIEDDYAQAPLATVVSLLDESYLGGS